MFETAEYHFYAALSHAASCVPALSDQGRFTSSRPAEGGLPFPRTPEDQQHCEALAAHLGQLEAWAENCPENFENRAALVGAEIARIEGRVLEAEQFYEEAIRSAHSNGFVQMRQSPTSSPRDSMQRVVSKNSQTHTCSKPGIAISAGGPMAK